MGPRGTRLLLMGARVCVFKLEVIYGTCVGDSIHHSSVMEGDMRLLLMCVLDHQPGGMQYERMWYKYIWILWGASRSSM